MRNRKKDRYTGAPPEIARAMEHFVPVEDFLPPPEELILKEDTEKITLALSKNSLNLFRSYARKHGGKYQAMIRRLIDGYAEKALVGK